MSKATSESEHLKDMLVGNILAVSWPEVLKTAALYAAVGAFHYVFRRQFLAISMTTTRRRRPQRELWDFLFYASFGFVVTSSVSIAGVLLVFCYLIVPSVAAMLYATASAGAWPSAGRWAPWSRRSGSTSRASSTCRPAPPWCAPSAGADPDGDRASLHPRARRRARLKTASARHQTVQDPVNYRFYR
jgi:hypothetical protein